MSVSVCILSSGEDRYGPVVLVILLRLLLLDRLGISLSFIRIAEASSFAYYGPHEAVV